MMTELYKQWIDLAQTEKEKGLRLVLVENYRYPEFQCEEALRRREAFVMDNPEGEYIFKESITEFQRALDDFNALKLRQESRLH